MGDEILGLCAYGGGFAYMMSIVCIAIMSGPTLTGWRLTVYVISIIYCSLVTVGGIVFALLYYNIVFCIFNIVSQRKMISFYYLFSCLLFILCFIDVIFYFINATKPNVLFFITLSYCCLFIGILLTYHLWNIKQNIFNSMISIKMLFTLKQCAPNVDEILSNDTWKQKDLLEWTCSELQNWMNSLDNIEEYEKKKVISEIRDVDAAGEDFAACNCANDIIESFNNINQSIGNKIYDALIEIQYGSYPKTWQNKDINEWTSDELQGWIVSLTLDKQNKQILIDAICQQEIDGADFNDVQSVDDIHHSFPQLNRDSSQLVYDQLYYMQNII